MNDYDDLEDDRYGWDDELYDDYNPCDDDPCSHCGIWCDHWGGDGLCLLQIEQQAMEDEEYHKNYLTEMYHALSVVNISINMKYQRISFGRGLVDFTIP